MKLRKIISITDKGEPGWPICCKAGQCPTVYETDNDSFVIQGWKLDAAVANEMQIPPNEDAIEVPKELIEAFIKKSLAR